MGEMLVGSMVVEGTAFQDRPGVYEREASGRTDGGSPAQLGLPSTGNNATPMLGLGSNGVTESSTETQLITLLLKQQQEMINELRDQKKLSESCKDEIGQWVLRSLAERLGLGVILPQRKKRKEKSKMNRGRGGGSKGVGKGARRGDKGRRLGRSLRSASNDCVIPSPSYGNAACPVDPEYNPAMRTESSRGSIQHGGPESGGYSDGQEEGVCSGLTQGAGYGVTIRQRLELQSPAADLTQDGRWLPSVLGSPKAAVRWPLSGVEARTQKPQTATIGALSSREGGSVMWGGSLEKGQHRPSTTARVQCRGHIDQTSSISRRVERYLNSNPLALKHFSAQQSSLDGEGGGKRFGRDKDTRGGKFGNGTSMPDSPLPTQNKGLVSREEQSFSQDRVRVSRKGVGGLRGMKSVPHRAGAGSGDSTRHSTRNSVGDKNTDNVGVVEPSGGGYLEGGNLEHETKKKSVGGMGAVHDGTADNGAMKMLERSRLLVERAKLLSRGYQTAEEEEAQEEAQGEGGGEGCRDRRLHGRQRSKGKAFSRTHPHDGSVTAIGSSGHAGSDSPGAPGVTRAATCPQGLLRNGASVSRENTGGRPLLTTVPSCLQGSGRWEGQLKGTGAGKRAGVRKHPSTVAGVKSGLGLGLDGAHSGPGNVINRGAGGAGVGKGRGGHHGCKVIAVPTRGQGDAVVVVPTRPSPIWFSGSGAIQAEWSALPGGRRVARDLESLEEKGRYTKYIAVVEGLLVAHLRADDQRGPVELVQHLWRQLVVTCTAFAVRNTENKQFCRALDLLKRAEVLLSRQVLNSRGTAELRAFVLDAYGLYYLRRGKATAALDYVQKAMKTHARMQVLHMVQEGKLDVGGNSPQKLCLVAICYHNIAVEQLIVRHVGEACVSSQNARRLARLCLSYSNRWLHSLEGTHKLALGELAMALSPPGAGDGKGQEKNPQHAEIFRRLTEDLFS